jgi:hypothetical protein
MLMQYLKLQKCGKRIFKKIAKESYEIFVLVHNTFKKFEQGTLIL